MTNKEIETFIKELKKSNIEHYLEYEKQNICRIFLKPQNSIWIGIELFNEPFGMYKGIKYLLLIFDPRENRQGLLRIPFVPTKNEKWNNININMLEEIKEKSIQIIWNYNNECLNKAKTFSELISKYDSFMEKYKTEKLSLQWCNFNNLEIQIHVNYEEVYLLAEEFKKNNIRVLFEYEQYQLYPQRMFICIDKENACFYNKSKSVFNLNFTCDTWGCYEIGYHNVLCSYIKLPFSDKKYHLREIVTSHTNFEDQKFLRQIYKPCNLYNRQLLYETSDKDVWLRKNLTNTAARKEINNSSYTDLYNELLFMSLSGRTTADIINRFGKELYPKEYNNQDLMEKYIEKKKKLGSFFIEY